MFQLYQVVNGAGHPVNDQQQFTGVFKPNTTITLVVSGNTFTATGSNSVDGETLSLTGTIAPNNFGGAGIAWTGSVPSATASSSASSRSLIPASKTIARRRNYASRRSTRRGRSILDSRPLFLADLHAPETVSWFPHDRRRPNRHRERAQ